MCLSKLQNATGVSFFMFLFQTDELGCAPGISGNRLPHPVTCVPQTCPPASMSSSNVISPNEAELVQEVRRLRNEHPTLGATKLLGVLRECKPEWTISEKRLKKVMQQEGLMVVSKQEHASKSGTEMRHPISKLNSAVDVKKWTKKLEIKQFDAVRGKGLVAIEEIAKDEELWTEDPWVLTADWCVIFSFYDQSIDYMLLGPHIQVPQLGKSVPFALVRSVCAKKSSSSIVRSALSSTDTATVFVTHALNPLIIPSCVKVKIQVANLSSRFFAKVRGPLHMH